MQSVNLALGDSVPSLLAQGTNYNIIFPGLTSSVPTVTSSPPSLYRHTVIVPKIAAFGRIRSIDDPYGEGYGMVLAHVLETMGNRRIGFHNRRKTELLPKEIRLKAHWRAIIEQEEAQIEGDYLPLYLNFVQLYGGYTSRDDQAVTLQDKYLALSSFYAAAYLLILPDKLIDWDNLYLLCHADEYRPEKMAHKDEWEYVPNFWRRSQKSKEWGFCVVPKWHAPEAE